MAHYNSVATDFIAERRSINASEAGLSFANRTAPISTDCVVVVTLLTCNYYPVSAKRTTNRRGINCIDAGIVNLYCAGRRTSVSIDEISVVTGCVVNDPVATDLQAS